MTKQEIVKEVAKATGIGTIKEKIERLKKELEEAMNDERFRNLTFVAGGNQTKSGRAYIRRQTGKRQED